MISRSIPVLIATLTVALFGSKLWAFPEMITHQYSSCNICHVSPYGGGVITSYGRSLSQELLSFKSNKTQAEESLDGHEMSETFLYGGDIRSVLLYLKNENVEKRQFVFMQAQVEGALNEPSWAVVARTGLVKKESENILAFLPVAYGLYRLTDNVSFRAGRFLPSYGLNTPAHFLSTRGALGFGFDDQRFGAEVSYLGESYSIFGSMYGSRDMAESGKSSQSLQVQFGPTTDSRWALNIWNEGANRTIWGTWFVTPVTDKTYVVGDFNYQTQLDSIKGYFSYLKAAYEFRQGAHVYWLFDQSQEDFKKGYTIQQKQGLGIQLFPMSHFEFDINILNDMNKLYFTKDGLYAYALLHYYL